MRAFIWHLPFAHIGAGSIAERFEAGPAHRWRNDARTFLVPVQPGTPFRPPGSILGSRVMFPFIRTERASAGSPDADAEMAVRVAGFADDARVVAAGRQHK